MKKFFSNIFSSIIALIVFSFISIASTIFIIAILSQDDIISISDQSILKLDFSESVVERSSGNPFGEINPMDFSFTQTTELSALIKVIDRAKDDQRIKGIYLNLSSFSLGVSQVEEIRSKLQDFKSNGKFIYSYSETYSQMSYYLASISDKIFLNPEGYVELNGISAGVMFFKELLDKAGLEAQIIRHGKFKSAVEPYMYNSMSEENRFQLEKMLNSLMDKIISDISLSRKISIQSINYAMNNLFLNNAEKCKELSFIDYITYEDEFKSHIEEEILDYEFISFSDYENSLKPDLFNEDKIAVIYANGPINTGKGTYNAIGSESLVEDINSAANDKSIKAIVLRINSPGGSALASDIILREVELAKKKKKIIVSMGEYAASGGYYIGCIADKIYANSNTITGSIGVFGVILNTKSLLNDKLGVYVDTVNTHKYSDMFSGTRPLTKFEKGVVQNSVKEVYNTFISHVSKGRNLSKEDVDKIGQGRVWSGIHAKEIGLVDEIGGLEEAITAAAQLSSLENYTVIEYPLKDDPFADIFMDFSVSSYLSNEFRKIGIPIENIKFYDDLDYIQTRMMMILDLN